MEKNEDFWRGLMRPMVTWQDACDEMEQMFATGVLPAMDPILRPPATVVVRVKASEDTTHCLFKDPRETKRKSYPRVRCDVQYRATHGERHAWIKPVLLEPDEVYERAYTGKPPRLRSFLYVSKTLPHERFVVIVHRAGHDHWLGTAYDVHLQDDEDKKWYDQTRDTYTVVHRKK